MKLRKITASVLSIIMLMQVFSLCVSASVIDPTQWAATDGLGRTLSTSELLSEKRDDRFVGMFYWIWHYPWVNDTAPITTGSVLDIYPEAVNDWDHPAWNNTYDGRPYFWGEPLYGFYTNTDEYILRKHAELLADAGIDTVIFDTTNQDIVFEEGYEALLRVWSEARQDGVNTPDIAFILNFGGAEDARSQLIQLYDNLYSQGRYEDMWFIWEDKPLIMADIRCLDLTQSKDREIYKFFTFRDNEATYFAADTSAFKDTWGWCSDYPQTLFGKDMCGNVEQICVSVAQNANENGLSAMNNPEGTVQGRSFTDGYFSYSYTYGGKEITVDKNIENSLLYGLNFQQQWDYAIEKDPEFIFVTGFNEWIAGRFEEWNGVENAFPDQFSPEYSRDIEPSAGILKDHYYYQLVENVRRFKGVSSREENSAEKTIDINGDISQWDDVFPEYNHYEGGKTRDSKGWIGYYYTNDTFRNDIIQSKVAYDDDCVYFFVKTKDTLSPCTDSDWMRLLIDTDTSGISANWESFEYIINRTSPENGKATLEKSVGGTQFEEVCKVDISINDNVLQIKVPRTALELTSEIVKFNFKWSDNLLSADATDFYVNGDTAPGGRFAYIFDSTDESAESDAQDNNPDSINSIFETIKSYFTLIFTGIKKLILYLFR